MHNISILLINTTDDDEFQGRKLDTHLRHHQLFDSVTKADKAERRMQEEDSAKDKTKTQDTKAQDSKNGVQSVHLPAMSIFVQSNPA